ncbi:MAG: hypothetical protein Q9160_006174 [Pyrenula sp. 1 TL-2023]
MSQAPTKHRLPPLPAPQDQNSEQERDLQPRRTLYDTLTAIDPSPQRLSLPPLIRIPVLTTLTCLTGFVLGFSHGAPLATYRYRAENAHRFPTTSTGWYLYHRTKGYHAVVGGVKHGMKMGAVLGFTVGSFLAVENAVDKVREERGLGTKDFGSTVVAGASVGGIWAAVKSRGEVMPAARMVKMGVRGGLVYGLAQDGMAWLRGHPPGYVRWVKGLMGGREPGNPDAVDGAKI